MDIVKIPKLDFNWKTIRKKYSNHQLFKTPRFGSLDILDMVSLIGLVTMEQNCGVGLAGNQTLSNERFIVWKDTDGLVHRWYDPYIRDDNFAECYSPLQTEIEGCLSIPNLYLPVTRYTKIVVTYFCVLDFKWKTQIFDDMNARIIQHEIDHLNGLTIIDRCDPKIFRSELKKLFAKYDKKFYNDFFLKS